MLNLHALRLFHRAAELGSVTKAAQQLNISQPAVTSQIKKLEREIGMTLLSPHGRGVFLTDAGVRLALDAGRLFALEREIEDTLEQYRLGHAGTLKIAATYLPANFLLPRWIARFKRENPQADVRFVTAGSAAVFELLLRYEADIAFIGGSQQDHPLLERSPWQEDEMWFVAHPDHRLADRETTLREIVREPFVFREVGSYSREQLLALCRVRRLPEPGIGLEMNGYNELIRVVADGYGIAFLSALEAREGIERGVLKRIYVQDVHVVNPIGLYTRKEPLPTHAQRFLEFMSSI